MCFEVDVLPVETEQLALAHPGGESEHVEGLEPVPARSLEEHLGLVGIQRPHLVTSHRRRVHEAGHVAGDHAPAGRLGLAGGALDASSGLVR